MSGKAVKVLALQTGGAFATLRTAGPEDLGGVGLPRKIQAEQDHTGEPWPFSIEDQVGQIHEEKVVRKN